MVGEGVNGGGLEGRGWIDVWVEKVCAMWCNRCNYVHGSSLSAEVNGIFCIPISVRPHNYSFRRATSHFRPVEIDKQGHPPVQCTSLIINQAR